MTRGAETGESVTENPLPAWRLHGLLCVNINIKRTALKCHQPTDPCHSEWNIWCGKVFFGLSKCPLSWRRRLHCNVNKRIKKTKTNLTNTVKCRQTLVNVSQPKHIPWVLIVVNSQRCHNSTAHRWCFFASRPVRNATIITFCRNSSDLCVFAKEESSWYSWPDPRVWFVRLFVRLYRNLYLIFMMCRTPLCCCCKFLSL